MTLGILCARRAIVKKQSSIPSGPWTWEITIDEDRSGNYTFFTAGIDAVWELEYEYDGVKEYISGVNSQGYMFFVIRDVPGKRWLRTSADLSPADSYGGTFYGAWEERYISSFSAIDLGHGVYFGKAWMNNRLTTFPLIDLGSGIDFFWAWISNELTTFPPIQFPYGKNFEGAWALNNFGDAFPLLSFPRGESFEGAWNNCNLTSFPAIDFPKGINFIDSWKDNSLTEFPEVYVGKGVDFTEAWRWNALVSFPALDFTSGITFSRAWEGNELATFPLVSFPNAQSLAYAWLDNKLTSFPAISFPQALLFMEAWKDNLLESFGPTQFPEATSFYRAWMNNHLSSFPVLNCPKVTDVHSAWENNLLTTFPLISFPSVTDIEAAWKDNLLTSFPELSLPLVTTAEYAWKNNFITAFPEIDFPVCTKFNGAWDNAGLTTFPAGIDISSGIKFDYAWANNKNLTSFPTLAFTSGTDFSSTWRDSGLTTFPVITFTAGKRFGYAWSGTSIVSFPVCDFSVGNIFTSAWADNDQLTTFPSMVFPVGSSFISAWANTPALVSFGALTTNYTGALDFRYAWMNSGLTTMPVVSCPNATSVLYDSAWENAPLVEFPVMNFSNGTSFASAWAGCRLNAQSVENILTALDAGGKTGLNTTITKDASPLTAAAESARASLVAKGWTVTIATNPSLIDCGTGATWTTVTCLPVFRAVNAATFSPDGRYMAVVEAPVSGSYGVLRIFDTTQSWAEVPIPTVDRIPFSSTTPYRSISFSPDGSYLIVGRVYQSGTTNFIHKLTVADWSLSSIPHGMGNKSVDTVAFSPDGSRLLVDMDGTNPRYKIFDTTSWTGIPNALPSVGGNLYDAEFSKNGEYIAIAYSAFPYLALVKTSDWTTIPLTSSVGGEIRCVSFKPDNLRVAASRMYSSSQNIAVFDVATGASWMNRGGSGIGVSCAYSPVRDRFAFCMDTTSASNRLREVNAPTMLTYSLIPNVSTLIPTKPNIVAWGPDASYLVCGHQNGCFVLNAD